MKGQAAITNKLNQTASSRLFVSVFPPMAMMTPTTIPKENKPAKFNAAITKNPLI